MTPSAKRPAFLAGGLFAAALAGFACTDDSGNGPGSPGTAGSGGRGGSGGSTGSAGTTGSGGGGGSSTTFTAVAPCNAESSYVSNTTTVMFGDVGTPAAPRIGYEPACLKVSAGATVTFTGDFAAHPLEPSTRRGTLTGSPITSTGSGTTHTYVFSTPGHYAYFCSVHGPSDGGAGMVGVVWVE